MADFIEYFLVGSGDLMAVAFLLWQERT